MTYMIQFVAFMRAQVLFEDLHEMPVTDILEELIDGNGEVLRQFKLVVDDHRGDDDKALVIILADDYVAWALQLMSEVDSSASESPLDELRIGRTPTYRPRVELPANPQVLYDRFEPSS